MKLDRHVRINQPKIVDADSAQWFPLLFHFHFFVSNFFAEVFLISPWNFMKIIDIIFRELSFIADLWNNFFYGSGVSTRERASKSDVGSPEALLLSLHTQGDSPNLRFLTCLALWFVRQARISTRLGEQSRLLERVFCLHHHHLHQMADPASIYESVMAEQEKFTELTKQLAAERSAVANQLEKVSGWGCRVGGRFLVFLCSAICGHKFTMKDAVRKWDAFRELEPTVR